MVFWNKISEIHTIMFSFFFLAHIINDEVLKSYRIQGGLVTVTLEISFSNQGDNEIQKYDFVIPEEESSKVGIVYASTLPIKRRSIKHDLTYEQSGNKYTFELKKPLWKGESDQIYISYTLSNYLLFLHSSIRLNQRISLYFGCNTSFFSPYETYKYKINIYGIYKSLITNISSLPRISQITSGVSLGPYLKDETPKGPLEIEFTTSHSLLRIQAYRVRTLVSHWAFSGQEIFVDAKNDGPQFKGEFNRIDFSDITPCVLKSIPLTVPKNSKKFFASDESGLLQKELTATNNVLEIPLRGPVLSSWHATFTAGWKMPTNSIISKKKDGNYLLSSSLFPATDIATLDSVSHDFILPEGSKVINVNIPCDSNITSRIEVENMDFKGRTIVNISINRILSTSDNIKVTIEYKLPLFGPWYKMFYLWTLFGITFISIVLFRRINCDLNIRKND